MSPRGRTALRLAVGGGAVAVAIALSAVVRGARAPEHPAKAAPASAGTALQVPRAHAPIPLGEEGDKAWEGDPGATGNFTTASGAGMVPYTQAKVRWDEGHLYLQLYAGDLDIQARATGRDADLAREDSFRVEIGGDHPYVLDVSPLGALSDAVCTAASASPGERAASCDGSWTSGAAIDVDVDGTIGKIHDNDEEWVVEMIVPLAALGVRGEAGARVPFRVSRCEVGHDGAHACGGWGFGARGGELVFAP